MSKLSDADVGLIRTLAAEGTSARSLADRFSVTEQHVA
jgi:hypothetical protein